MPSKRTSETEIVVEPLLREQVQFAVIGTSPLICNRMSEKAKRDLLFPSGRKTAAERQSNLKHNPIQEFRDSPYVLPAGPTLLGVMSSAFKGAMKTAALDTPGAKKTQIGRLVYVTGDYVPVYGVPELFMSITRSADISRTPDVRTRAILPRWAALVTIEYAVPLITEKTVANLLSSGGMVSGIGDWRPEKGSGNYGQYRLTNADDPEFLVIVEEGGRSAQQAAIADPEFYDRESEELFSWFNDELSRRGRKAA